MRKLLFIYLITNKVNNKQYITSSFTQPDYYKKYFYHVENRLNFSKVLLQDFNEHKNYKGYNTGFLIEFLDAKFISEDSDKNKILNYHINKYNPYYNIEESNKIELNKELFNSNKKDHNFRYNLYRKMKILRKIINGNYNQYLHYKAYKSYIEEFLQTGTIKFYEENIDIIKIYEL